MFAIVQVGTLQYKVAEGDTIDVQRLDAKEGKTITLDQVLLFADGSKVSVGQPYLKNVKVSAKVLREHLAEKAVSFKYRRRKNKSWKKGHRQKLVSLSISKIHCEK